MNPTRRLTYFMSMEAGIVAIAAPTNCVNMGKVAQEWCGANWLPTKAATEIWLESPATHSAQQAIKMTRFAQLIMATNLPSLGISGRTSTRPLRDYHP